MKRLFSQLHRPLRNERGEITFFACFFVVGVVMLISFLLLYASVRITCINIRNGAKMELNNLSATIYADTYRSQRETNFEEYLRTLYSSRDYTEMLEATVAGGLAEKVPLSTDDYTVSDISLEFNVGMGDPFFCKYICPQGVLEGAIPLAAVNEGIRSALGSLFTWKLAVLIAIIFLSILFYRPFCKWLCPLGAFYALMNKVSLFGIKVDEHKCVSCGKCAGACKMDVDITKTPDHAECIRCGKCISVCPTEAVSFRYGFNLPKTLSSGNEKPKNDKKSK